MGWAMRDEKFPYHRMLNIILVSFCVWNEFQWRFVRIHCGFCCFSSRSLARQQFEPQTPTFFAALIYRVHAINTSFFPTQTCFLLRFFNLDARWNENKFVQRRQFFPCLSYAFVDEEMKIASWSLSNPLWTMHERTFELEIKWILCFSWFLFSSL